MHAPAIVSVNQCAARYVRLIAMSPANAAAKPIAIHRRGDAGNSTTTRPNAVTAPAMAWPDGNDAPLVPMSGFGRARSIDERLQRTDAQLGRDHRTDERAELQPAAMPHQNRRHEQPQRQRHLRPSRSC